MNEMLMRCYATVFFASALPGSSWIDDYLLLYDCDFAMTNTQVCVRVHEQAHDMIDQQHV